MAFVLGNAVVLLETNLPSLVPGGSGSLLLSGVMISPNVALTASHALMDAETGVTATEVNLFTGATITASGGNVGIESQRIFSGSAVSANPVINVATGGFVNGNVSVAQDYGLVLLSSDAQMGDNSPTGYASLLQDSNFVGSGGSALQSGYPVDVINGQIQDGTYPQVQTPESLTENPTSDPNYSYYSTDNFNSQGSSGGGSMAQYAGAYSAAGVQSAVLENGSGSKLAALTPTAIAQIETWLSNAPYNQAPAVRRLYNILLNRQADASGLAFYSSSFASVQSNVASSLGVEYASGAQVMAADTGFADAFLQSGEFQDLHPNISNGDLVNLLYNQGFGRAADATGFDFWVGQLDAGELTQGEAVGIFSNDPEAIAHAGVWGQQ